MQNSQNSLELAALKLIQERLDEAVRAALAKLSPDELRDLLSTGRKYPENFFDSIRIKTGENDGKAK